MYVVRFQANILPNADDTVLYLKFKIIYVITRPNFDFF
jgi:hypothetical protein